MATAPENPFERIPPHDEAAEAAVLGAMLLDPQAADLALEMLVKDDFYARHHLLLFELFAKLCEQSPRLDTVIVESALRERGLVERVGGTEVLGRLVEACPSPAAVERYCKIVQERAVERSLLGAARQIVELCQQPADADDDRGSPLDRAEQLVYQIADKRVRDEAVPLNQVLATVVAEAEKHVAARQAGQELPSPALATHFKDLDDKFAGGLWPGEVVVIAARPSVGKTTFMLNIARQMALRPEREQPVAVAIFSMEMPREQLAKNILCAEARVPSGRMRRYELEPALLENIQAAAANLSRAPIIIDDTPALTPAMLRARARRLCHSSQVRILMLDYLQLMRSGRRTDTREQEVADVSRQVKEVARELRIPIILLSQLRRPPQGMEGAVPNITDLRESGAIEQDADVVVMLHRALDKDTKIYSDETKAIIQKNRNGETGNVQLTFIPSQFRFETFSPERDA